MGIMSVFKWLRKDGNVERHPWSMPPELCRLNNETCRIKAIRAFMDRRKSGTDSGCLLITSPDKEFHFKTYVKKNNENNKVKDDNNFIPGVPHILPSELFEIGWVAGTEDRYLEYIYAEWDNTKVSVKKHTHPECESAIKADLAVLTEIRHPNIVLLIATSQIKDHGIISIFEFLNCTLYSYIHEKGERISVQEVSRCARKLAEALGFAHMRGFIHGAISSHCVFLASGVVKLGGWELATQKDQPKSKQEFEARLRSEIFRWQAPEIFCGRAPIEATDVYGLSLLIWEMTTMHLPWSGLSKAEVERQYVHWERGVMIDLYNFPQLLSKLLEAGLQIDVTKRTMNMNRMRRFLQRLELQYESEAPIYANQYTNNNNINQNSKVCNVPACTSPTSKCPTTPVSSENSKPAPKTLFNSQKKVCNRLMRSSSKKELIHKESPRLKFDDKKDTNLPEKKNANLFLEGRLHNEVHDSVDEGHEEFRYTTFSSPEQRTEEAEVQMSIENEADEEILSTAEDILSTAEDILSTAEDILSTAEEIHSTTEERVSSNYGSESTRTLESSSDEDFTDTRNEIKKLRETLATKRERFFYGNDLDQVPNADTNTGTEEKNAILERVRSKDYEPHKPASHKTSWEPKLNKSLQCETMLIKPASHQEQKTANSSFPSEIKEAVLNPQLFNANCQDVFESSMWRREKMICLSKMRKSDPQNIVPQNSLPRPEILKPVVKNETFIIKELDEQETDGNSTLRSETCSQGNEDSENKSLVALKQALDRATDIIRPSSPVSDESRHSSPLRTLDENLEITPEGLETREALFENVFSSKIGSVDPDAEIRSIERIPNAKGLDQLSQNTYKIKKGAATCLSLSEPKSQCLGEMSVNESEEKENDTNNMTLMLFSDKNHDKGCNSCHHMTALARRRSLPAALGQLKAYSRLSIGRLPIRRGDYPDSTVEDLYIDDEFGDSLNVNMVLLEGDDIALDEDDILPDLLELTHHSPPNA